MSNDLDLRSSPRFDIRCMACFIGASRRYLYALAQGVPDDYSFLLVIKSNFSRSLKVKEDTDQLDCGVLVARCAHTDPVVEPLFKVFSGDTRKRARISEVVSSWALLIVDRMVSAFESY